MADTFTGETYNTLCDDAEGYLASESSEQARELLLKAISLIGTRPRARSLLSDTCMSMELWSEARSQLEILITLEEGNINNNFRLAQVLEELGEYQLAFDNYSVVVEDDPGHHGAVVALKRIAARTKETGVNLADIFSTSGEEPGSSDESDLADKQEEELLKEGIQVFPDVPSDKLFADSDSEEESSIEKLLKNIGISSDLSDEENEDDVSKLLENIGVSSMETLQSAFSDSSDIDSEADSAKGLADPEGSVAEGADSGSTVETEEKHHDVPSLDEIFGTSSEPPDEEDVSEADEEEPVSVAEEEEKAEEPEETVEEEPDAVETEEEPDKAEEEQVTEEGIPKDTERTEEEISEGDEPVEPEIKVVIGETQEEDAVPETHEEPEYQDEESEAVLTIDPWSSESGLLTVHLASGSVQLHQSLLAVYETSITSASIEDGSCRISGQGTFLLNCGPVEPLILELTDNMVIRLNALILSTGRINSEPLDVRRQDSLSLLREQSRVKAVFKTPAPVRIILLGSSNRVFNVRSSSIMASDPGILLSDANSPEGYTVISGQGKIYLIE